MSSMSRSMDGYGWWCNLVVNINNMYIYIYGINNFLLMFIHLFIYLFIYYVLNYLFISYPIFIGYSAMPPPYIPTPQLQPSTKKWLVIPTALVNPQGTQPSCWPGSAPQSWVPVPQSGGWRPGRPGPREHGRADRSANPWRAEGRLRMAASCCVWSQHWGEKKHFMLRHAAPCCAMPWLCQTV